MNLIYFTIALFTLMVSGCSEPQPLKHTFTCNFEAAKRQNIYSLRSAQCLCDSELLQRIDPYRVIFVGDHHDEAEVQHFVAKLITMLADHGKKIHCANEWFTPQENALLKSYTSGDINASTLKQKSLWSQRVGFDFKNYELIYKSVKEVNGSLYGINLSKSFQKLISKNTKVEMTWEQQEFLNHLDVNVTAHKELIAPYLHHCKQAKSVALCTERMYRVQVAWDSYMGHQSAQLANSLIKEQNAVLIVFVGAMHLSNALGVNLRFARESNLPFVTLLPRADTEHTVNSAEADYLFLYQAKEDER
jgi:uncharacterized iron-regulated protein